MVKYSDLTATSQRAVRDWIRNRAHTEEGLSAMVLAVETYSDPQRVLKSARNLWSTGHFPETFPNDLLGFLETVRPSRVKLRT